MLLYHLVCVTKGRDKEFTQEVDRKLKEICLEIARRYEIHFLEIGADKDHVHFLIQSVPMYQPTKITRIVKSLTARELLKQMPELKKHLWGGEFWSNGYFINTVGRKGSETVITTYIKNQGKGSNYTQLHKDQLRLW